MKQTPPRETLSIRVPPALLKKIRALAEDQVRTMSSMTVVLIQKGLTK